MMESKYVTFVSHIFYYFFISENTGLFEIIVGVLTTCHKQYT